MSIHLPIRATAIGLCFSLIAIAQANAASFTFTKIADTNTAIPGGTGNFIDFGNGAPSLDNGNVAFWGAGTGQQQGIYTNVGGILNVVADRNTAIPGGTGSFTDSSFRLFPSLDNGNVAFSTSNLTTGQRGIYTNVGGVLNVVVDTNTAIPGGIGNFTFLNLPSLSNGNVAFLGRDSMGQDGIYTNIGGSLNVVADRNTAIPGGTGNFAVFRNFPSLNNESVAFIGGSVGQLGVYTNLGGVLNVVANTNTPIPGGTGNFTGFGRFTSLNNGTLAFQGFGAAKQQGIYSNLNGVLNLVANTNTPIPDGTGNFTGFYDPSWLNNGTVAFLGLGSTGQKGIYANLNSTLTKVIDLSDLLDGKTISDLSFSTEGLSGSQIAFQAIFTDGSEGIFLTDGGSQFPPQTSVPEPSSALGMLAFGAFGAAAMRKRKQKKPLNSAS
jgi:PEP-CTERM motif